MNTVRFATAGAVSALIFAAAHPAMAQQSAPAPVADAAQRGVLIFTPDFFADQRPNTAQDMVNRVPGFSTQDGDGSRGFEGAVGNILINGARPASKNDTGSSVLSRTLASQVERIELIRGGAPGIDMQGYAVVVNVILKRENTRQSVLSMNATLFNGGPDLFGGSYQFSARDGDRTWGFTLSDGISSDDGNGVGRVRRIDGAGAVLRDEALRTEGYGGSNGLRGNYSSPFMGGKLDLTGRIGRGDWHNVTEQMAPDILRYSTYDNENINGEVGVVFTRPMAQGVTLETRFIHTAADFDNTSLSNGFIGATVSPEQVFTAEGLESETILRALTRWEHSPKVTLETGGEIAYNLLDVTQAFSVDGTAIPLPSATVKVEETRGEVFGRGTWRIHPDLTLEGGVRIEASNIRQSGDASQEKSFVFAKPRLLATWTPIPSHQIRLRIEREVGQLDFGDFAASADLDSETLYGGNVDLEPESRWIGEITYERRFWGEGVFSVGYRRDAVSNYIDVIPLKDGLSATGNIGDGWYEQFSVNLVIPADRIGFTGGRFSFRNNWIDTEVTDPTTGLKRSVTGLRESQPNFTVTQDIASWNIQWGATILTRLGQTTHNPDFTSSWRAGGDYFQAYVEYKPKPDLTVRVQLTDWDDFNFTRIGYANRTTRPVAYVETRSVNPRTFWNVSLRKTF